MPACLHAAASPVDPVDDRETVGRTADEGVLQVDVDERRAL